MVPHSDQLAWTGDERYCRIAVHQGTEFPGYAALLPTVGAAMIIVASFGAPKRGAGRLLAFQPMPYIGDRSYTFYLWHFPVLIIVAEAAGHALSVGDNLLLLLGAFALSIVTYKFYENPMRHWSALRRMDSAFLVGAVIAVAVILSLTAALRSVDDKALSETAAAEITKIAALAPATQLATTTTSSATRTSPAPIPAVVRAVAKQKIPANLTPPVASLERDGYFPPSGCIPGLHGTTSNVCRLADSASHRTLVVLGDSHAKMWMPAILYAAQRQGYAVVPLLHLQCSAFRFSSGQYDCGAWYRWAVGQAQQLHPTATLIATAYDVLLAASDQNGTVTGLSRAFRSLPNPVLIQDPPSQSEQPVDCLLKPNATLGICTSRQTSASIDELRVTGNLAAQHKVPVLPTIEWFCTTAGECPTVINGTVAFEDLSHLENLCH